MKKAVLISLLSFVCGGVFSGLCRAQDSKPLLMQSPTLSKTQIAFAYGGDIWIVDRNGGDARRLVTGTGLESGPIFSPDGSMVAYTGDYDGNQDVYVVPTTGGDPRRLTHHPATDVALGWTRDGKSVLFRSTRNSYSRFEKLFTVSVEGGFPTELPLPMGVQASYSPDASHLAYVPRWNRRLGAGNNYIAIKHYRGGLTSPIWIADLADSSVVKIPRENSNDFNPMWIADNIYFLSDRDGGVTLFAYNTKTKDVKELLKHSGFDFKSASAGPDAIVYEQLGSLHLFDLASGKETRVDVRIAADMPQVRPHFEKVGEHILHAQISPTGQRAVFEAHGEILTVPGDKGDIRNITRSPGAEDRDPAWSPDGRSIAYFSDESGEYALYVSPQDGLAAPRKIDLGEPPSFFYSPRWSPDSKKITYNDKRLNLWYVDLDHPATVKVDTDRFDSPLHEFDATWSPDSRWLAYTKQLDNHFRAVFAYSLEDRKATQVTDGMSDALYPAFDKNGKYLYFTASTDLALSTGWLDMTSIDHPVTRAVYVEVLRKDLPSPIAPESDEEKASESKDAKPDQPADQDKDKKDKDEGKDKEKEKKEPPKVTIDFDALGQRILSLPLPERNYLALSTGKEGIVYVAEGPQVDNGPTRETLQRFDLKTRKTDKLLDGIQDFVISANGEKVLYKQGEKWFIASADKSLKPNDGQLKTEDMEVYVDPRAEWKQIYHEIWRIERDFFYDPHFHGLNLKAAEAAYEPFLAGVTSRADLDYLFADMLGNLNVLHMYVGGGTQPELKTVKVGLLGADYSLENGRYRFARIYNGENWNPQLHAPLTQPGVNVKEGEYLLAVNGRDLHSREDVYAFFQETAGKQVGLKVGPNSDGSGSRDVTVVPVDSMTREGATYSEPQEAIFGPKTMIINEFAGSGGDAMPWYFRKAGVGPLVGMRTWGGLVGIGNYPQLIDGGNVTAPRWAIYGTEGEWEVENHGIAPDVEVELDPKLVRQGHDPQLEKAVEVMLESLKEHPLPTYKHPDYPNYRPVF